MTDQDMFNKMIDILKEQKGENVNSIASKMGMSTSSFNNRLYKNRQEFNIDSLVRLQELSESTILAEYCLPEGYVIVKEPSASDCDLVELATIIIETQGAHGDLQAFIKTALSDDRLTQDEQFGIDAKKKAYISHLERQLKALKLIYGEK